MQRHSIHKDMDVLELVRTSMWIVSVATLIVTFVLGLILGYHWKRYSGSPRVAKISVMTYSAVSLMLGIALFSSIPL